MQTNFIFAQAAEGAGQQNPMGFMIMMGLFFLAMWFLIIAPQRKRAKEHQKMMDSLKPGDEIITSGGMYATIQQVREDRFVVKVADGVRLDLAKGYIAGKVGAEADKK
jgi:preprotein translocase subunit YajC